VTAEPQQAVVGHPGGIRVRWRVGHSDVMAEVELIGGHLIVASDASLISALNPATGRALA